RPQIERRIAERVIDHEVQRLALLRSLHGLKRIAAVGIALAVAVDVHAAEIASCNVQGAKVLAQKLLIGLTQQPPALAVGDSLLQQLGPHDLDELHARLRPRQRLSAEVEAVY